MSVPAELGWEVWAPPLNPPDSAGLPVEVAQAIADKYWPQYPYLTAGLQWQAYALMLPPEPAVTSVSTGVQSVNYQSGSSPFDVAMARADWFMERYFEEGNLSSVPLTSGVPISDTPLRDMSWWIDP